MSFIVTYRRFGRTKVVFSKTVQRRLTPSPSFEGEDGASFGVGELFGMSPDAVLSSGWQANPGLINSLDVSVTLVSADHKRCNFLIDARGMEPLYVLHRSDCFAVSDSLWDIVRFLKPSFDDIDTEALQESLAIGGTPFSGKLFIKGMRVVTGNRAGSFDSEAWTFDLSQYAGYRHSGEVDNLDDAVELMDAAMKGAAGAIGRNFGACKYGLGLSGGLDSRIALHYLLDAGLDVAAFNTCVKRPHRLLLAKSLKNSRELARVSGVEYKEVEWGTARLREKIDLQLASKPTGPADFYKYEAIGMPSFDVMISGAGIGTYLLGCGIPENLSLLTVSDIVQAMYQIYMYFVQPLSESKSSINSFCKKRRIPMPFMERDQLWDALVPPSAYETIVDDISCFVQRKAENGYALGDILFEGKARAQCPGRFGAFESRFGTVRSLPYDTPFTFNAGLKISIDLLRGRKLHKELIRKKAPEFAAVPEEGVSLSRRGINAYLSRLEYFARGSGHLAIEWFAKDPAIKREFFEDMNNECTWFWDLFGLSRKTWEVWGMSPTRKNVIWATKLIIDRLEQGRY